MPGTALKEEHHQQLIEVDNSDTKSERLKLKVKPSAGPKGDALSTNGDNGGRRVINKYRVRRQDVRFMKRGAADSNKLHDARSEMPLAANDASWQRFKTVEQRSE